jgi:hypothetical protein
VIGLLDRLMGSRRGATAPPVRPIGTGAHGQPIAYPEDAVGLRDEFVTLEQRLADEDDMPLPLRPVVAPDMVNGFVDDTTYHEAYTETPWTLNGAPIVVSRFYRFKGLVVDILPDGQADLIRRRRAVLEARGIAYVAYLESDELTEGLFTAQWKASAKRAARILRSKTLR